LVDFPYIALLCVHVGAASVWIGGAIFSELVLNPTLRSFPVFQAARLSTDAARTFTRTVWVSFFLIFSTGIIMLYWRNWLTLSYLAYDATGQLMLAGLILSALAIANGAVITFVLAPRRSAWIERAIRINSVIGTAAVLLMVLFSEGVRS